MIKRIVSLLGILSSVSILCLGKVDKSFVILIASYNNERWCEWSTRSALAQKYDNFRIIYIDDCSKDRTADIVQRIVREEDPKGRITFVRNEVRKGALYNQYTATHDLCRQDEIVVILDGDDALAHDHVLSYLNNVYKSGEVWLTYGQYQELKGGARGFCCPMPEAVVRNNTFRQWQHIPSHLRTYYVWLFNNVKKEDLLMQDGSFYSMSGDMAVMIPMIEMARDHYKFIPDVLYTYNNTNPISDHMVDKKLQRSIDLHVRSLHRYQPLTRAPMSL